MISGSCTRLTSFYKMLHCQTLPPLVLKHTPVISPVILPGELGSGEFDVKGIPRGEVFTSFTTKESLMLVVFSQAVFSPGFCLGESQGPLF